MARRGWTKDEIHQGLLEQRVRELFVGENAAQNVRKNAFIKSHKTGKYLELDIWLPKLHICFEFQDAYHYVPSWYYHAPLDVVEWNDSAKREATLQKGETLILVPCWWDGTKESLATTILSHRPDLLSGFDLSSFFPIPLNPPKYFFKGGKIIGVGELMLASFPMQEQFNHNFDETFWWMGEKYDGVRFCWNSYVKVLYTRTGHSIQTPPKFCATFPRIYLDGEIWFGKGKFQDSQTLILAEDLQIDWSLLRFVAFDEPSWGSQHLPFESRYSSLVHGISNIHPFLLMAARVKCESQGEMTKWLESILSDGGEGIVLRKPKSGYEQGRSTDLLKIKAARGDREALVVTSNSVSTVLKLPDETEFTVPTPPDIQQPKRGDVATFSYTTFSAKSIPTNARIVRVRRDIAWDDVLREHAAHPVHKLALNETSRNLVEKRKTTLLSDKAKKMRKTLEEYAQRKNYDPLLAENWYSFRKKTLESIKGGSSILKHFQNSHVHALLELFPEIGLERNRFLGIPRHYWADLENRRRFLLDFAKHERFDPKVPENWYKLTQNQFLAQKGGIGFLSQYDGDWTKALIHLFPNIDFDSKRFKYPPKTYWKIRDRKKLFEDFAKHKGFDPKKAKNWYLVRKEEIVKFKDMNKVLTYYDENVSSALLQLFPNLEKEKLMLTSRAYWKDRKNQKELFLAIAKEKGFDPLNPENWYSLKYNTVISFKGGASTLSHYKGNYREALAHVFPNIGLHLDKFSTMPRGFWKLKKKQE